jgi:hypothetical protein
MSSKWAPPEEVTLKEVKINVEDLEPILRGLESPLLAKDYPPRYLTLPNGEKMVVRRALKEEAPIVMQTAKQLFDHAVDFYDVVAPRVYAEFAAWYRSRIKDHASLVGVINGELAAIANFRLWDESTVISLHTMTFKRRSGIGSLMYVAKMEYVFDYMGVKEWWATYESYTGLRYWALKLAQNEKPYPQNQHELGGARIYYNTRDDWERLVKPMFEKQLGTRPVPKSLLETSKPLKVPAKIEV